jgi:hypothetical protein
MHLREAVDLSPKSLQAATLGLAGTWYGVHMRDGTDTIAMGRIIGDGGCFFKWCILPSSQSIKGKAWAHASWLP